MGYYPNADAASLAAYFLASQQLQHEREELDTLITEIERRGLSDTYARRLFAIVTGAEWDVTLYGEGWVNDDQLWALLRATPEQQQQAALIALGESSIDDKQS